MYGGRRLQVTLLREGISVGRRRIRRLMRKLGLWAIRPTRNTSKAASRAQDLPLSAARQNDRSAEPALGEALKPNIFNTDQGSQFTGEAFTRVLLDHRIEISMDGCGRCHGRVEVWRSCCRLNISVAAPFVWRCLTGSTLAPSPHPARQTGHADFPHPAFSRPVRPSLSAGRRVAVERCRGRASRRDTRLGSGGTQRLVVPCGASTSDGPVVPCMPERAHRFL